MTAHSQPSDQSGNGASSNPSQHSMLAINGSMMPSLEEDRAPGAAALDRIYNELQELEESDLEWYAQFDASDLMQSTQHELASLLETAPSCVARGFMAGVMAMRVHIAQMTLRPII
jgi:hypothetical protein